MMVPPGGGSDSIDGAGRARHGGGGRWCVAAAALSGCGLPRRELVSAAGHQGGGHGSYTIQAQMPDVQNLEQNSRVRVNDVTVGNVTKIERQGWHALVTMTTQRGRRPARQRDRHARADQPARLGARRAGAAHRRPARGQAQDGSLIPLSSAGAYPSTEQTLAAVSLVLNGGGSGRSRTSPRR